MDYLVKDKKLELKYQPGKGAFVLASDSLKSQIVTSSMDLVINKKALQNARLFLCSPFRT
jgi:hypothetical protein